MFGGSSSSLELSFQVDTHLFSFLLDCAGCAQVGQLYLCIMLLTSDLEDGSFTTAPGTQQEKKLGSCDICSGIVNLVHVYLVPAAIL